MPHRRFSNLGLIIAVVAILGALVGYWTLVRKEISSFPQPSPQPLPVPAGGTAGRGGDLGGQCGEHLISVEMRESEGAEGQSVYFVTVDGNEGRNYDLVSYFVCSPDGGQYAYVAGREGKQFVVLNGKELKSYDTIVTPVFSPNSRRFIYVAARNKNWLVVSDDSEGKTYVSVELAFSDFGRGFSFDSKHIIYSATKSGKQFIVIDDKEGKTYDRISMLTISADGKITYEAQTGSQRETITEELDQEPEPDNKAEPSPLEQSIKTALERILKSQSPQGYAPIPPGVRILGVKVEGNTITLDFSKELLANGRGAALEDAIHQILVGLGNAIPQIKDIEYKILIEGEALDKLR